MIQLAGSISSIKKWGKKYNKIMTDSERNEYNALSYSGRRAYDRAKNDHPTWSHSQLLMFAKVNGDIEIAVEGGKDITLGDVLLDILKEAKSWLEDFADISWTVLNALDEAISSLGRALADGARWVGNRIGDFLDWLFG